VQFDAICFHKLFLHEGEYNGKKHHYEIEKQENEIEKCNPPRSVLH
jgi:hypothetical protein